MTKRESRTIVIDLSGHGFGHLGQIAPVINELIAQYPVAKIIVRSGHSVSVIRSFLGFGVEIGTPPPEATLIMHGPTVVDRAASAEAYRFLHARWDEHLDRETGRFASIAPVALVADVPYLSLAAAKRLGIPAVALCSLNWLDLYRAYCGQGRDAPEIMRTIKAAYSSADCFLQPSPHMPMSDLSNRRSIGPVARIGRHRKDEIRVALGISRDEHLVLATFGGIRSEQRLRPPSIPGVHWLVASDHSEASANMTEVSRLDMSFIDVLASCDAVVTKVGYCTFVEAACNGVGVVSAPRTDWPESGPLIEWATQNANFSLAEGGTESAQDLRAALSVVLNAPRKAPVSATGVAEAVEVIADIAGLI